MQQPRFSSRRSETLVASGVTNVLFDCDGTLVDSETIAFRECTGFINRLLTQKSCNLQFSPKDLQAQFLGVSFHGIVASLSKAYSFPITPDELATLAKEEEMHVITALRREVQPCDEVPATVQQLAETGMVLSVVSSSSLPRIEACLEKTDLAAYFPPERIFSCVTSLPRPESKPSPAVYIHALRKLGIRACDAVAVEDSVNGTLAAVNAGLSVIGYIGSHSDPRDRDAHGDRLASAGARAIVSRFSDIPDLISQ